MPDPTPAEKIDPRLADAATEEVVARPKRWSQRATAEDAGPADDRPEDAPTPAANQKKSTPFTFDPLAPYKGAFRRFFTVYRHVLGLLAGGVIAYVRALPPGERKGFNRLWARTWAFLLTPFVKREMRARPFPQQLRRRLEILGPTFIKLGQIMAIREDLLPKEITRELENLLDRLPQIPFAQVRAILERDLGAPAGAIFAHIDEEPLGSASIAQAHRAETRDGKAVVFKVIKPGIREVIISDLKLLEAVGILLQWLLPRYQPRQIIEEFSAYTRREIDYSFEADNAEIFAANFQDLPGVVFPEIYRELSSEDVLTMEYIEGIRPGSAEALALNEAERKRVVDLGAASVIRMLYKDGFFHADLHAGNLRILPGEPLRIAFIDLGMVGRFGQKMKRRLLYYFHALVRGDIENATRHLLEMARIGPGGDPQGFRRAVADLARRFLMHSERGDFSVAQLILASLALGGKHRIFFPVEMTLMVKALVTYEGVGRMLDPNLNIAGVSQKHVQQIFQDRFDPRTLGSELVSSAPELVDVAVQLPQLVAASARFLEETLDNRRPREHPLAGLRSSIVSGACIVGGTLAAVQGGPWFLWLPLFLSSFWFYFFGKK